MLKFVRRPVISPMNRNKYSNRNPFEKILKKKPESLSPKEAMSKADMGDVIYELLDSDDDEKRIDQRITPTEGEVLNNKNLKENTKEVKVLNATNSLRTVENHLNEPKTYKLVDPEIPSSRKEIPKPILPKYQRVYGSDGDSFEKKNALKKRKMNDQNRIVVDNKKYVLSIDTHKAIRNYTDSELTERHNKADKNLAKSWKSIISKYENLAKDETLSDVVDLKTGRIVIDNGHLKSLTQQDTLKQTEDRNYNALGRIKNSYDDDFLDLLSSENIVNEARKKDIDIMDLKERGILKGLNLNLQMSISDLDTDDDEAEDDESYKITSEDEFLSEAETINSNSNSDIEVDEEIEDSFCSE